jgi:PilZ domain
LDATHFRQSAARAREMAQSGDDMQLSRMLLEVAIDLDAEAEAMESSSATDRRGFQRVAGSGIYGALLHLVGSGTDPKPVQLIDLSMSGARFRIDRTQTPGAKVILELPDQTLRLGGTIVRAAGTEAVMVFEAASSADPALRQLVRSEWRTERVRA